MALRRAGKGYVLGVNATQPFNAWIGKPEVAGTAEEIAKGLDPSAWQRLSAGEGTKGPRLYDWAYLELADLDAEQYGGSATGTWTRGLLIRRNLANGKCAYFTTWCPVGTTIETLVAVEGQRWVIEVVFPQMTKTNLLTTRGGGQGVTDLDIGVRDDHPVDEEQHELAALFEARPGQAALHPLSERLQ